MRIMRFGPVELELGHGIVYEIGEATGSEEHDDVVSFVEQAVDNNIQSIYKMTRGYDDLYELIEYLSMIDDILSISFGAEIDISLSDDPEPDVYRVRFSRPAKHDVQVVSDTTKMDTDDVVRLCILKELEEYYAHTDHPAQYRIRHTIKSAELLLGSVEQRFMGILRMYFYGTDHGAVGISRSEKSSMFAEYYVTEFYGSDLHEKLKSDDIDGDIIQATEDVINKHSCYEIDDVTSAEKQLTLDESR